MSYPEKDSVGEQFEDIYRKLGGLKKLIEESSGVPVLASGTSAALVVGATTVNTTAITPTSKVFLTNAIGSTNTGNLSPANIVNGVSFDIISGNPGDTGAVNWFIIT